MVDLFHSWRTKGLTFIVIQQLKKRLKEWLELKGQQILLLETEKKRKRMKEKWRKELDFEIFR